MAVVTEIKPITNKDIHKKALVNPDYDPEKSKSDLSEIRHTGFYYDAQLSDDSMIMSLHPSTYNNGNEWVKFDEGYPVFYSGEITHYSKIPIAVCLLNEDPTFSVSNRFTDFNGGNPIEDIFNSLKPYAPLAGKIAKGLGEADTDTKYGGAVTDFLNNVAKKGQTFMSKAENYLNKALFVQGTRFTYYNGSDFSTSQMEMKFTKFSEYNNKGEFINVAEYIGDVLAPYSFGRYRSLSDTGADKKSYGGGMLGTITKEIAEYVGVQSPPGGFRMDSKSLHNALFGTLRLNIGGVYAIENLIIKNLTFSFSRSQTKNPEKPGETVPLYADISITLTPAAMLTDNSMQKILAGDGLKTSMQTRASDNKTQLEKMKADRKSSFSSVKIKNY